VNVALLTDFGSTYTKVAAVNLDGGSLVGLGQCRTTVDTDVLDGYEEAVDSAIADIAGMKRIVIDVAASSAGGGLRMVAIGLVADLTAKAAEVAALNAGARVEGVLAGALGEDDLEFLERVKPEIVLFAGGTDGGDRRRVLDNVDLVRSADINTLIVVACNGEIADEVKSRFEAGGHQATVVSNVMPEIGKVNVDPARSVINQLFLSHVIRGKHLSSSRRFEELVKMATPEAVLHATSFIAHTPGLSQIGDAVLVSDVGGATTDIYSAQVRRSIGSAGTSNKGLATPSVTRTVQGDLGIRFNATSVLASDRAWLEGQVVAPEELQNACEYRRQEPSVVFSDGWQRELDEKLAVTCMTNGLRRHCGTFQIRVGLGGKPKYVQTPPDLRHAGTLIAGGGIIRESQAAEEIVRAALDRQEEGVLAPRSCRVVIDKRYVLAAIGLLAKEKSEAASGLLKSELGWSESC
jgi:uncharacterized protein (TIGR01319 family)